MMEKKHLATGGWCALVVLAFGMGWQLKPVPETAGDKRGTSAGTPGSASAARSANLTATKKKDPDKDAGGIVGADPDIAPSTRVIPSSRVVLSTADIEEFGSQIRREADPIKRRMAFAKLLEGMTLENALEIREQVAYLPVHSEEFRDFHYAFGKIGGAGAVLNGADTKKPDMLATLAGWASADPDSAMDWFSKLDPASDNYANQGYLKMGLVHGLSDVDPEMATRFVLGRAEAGDKRASEMLGVVTGKVLHSQGPEAAAAWAADLPDDRLRVSAMGRVAHEFARKDPQAAAAWAEGVAGEPASAQIVEDVSREWAQRDGDAAVGWLQSLDGVPGQDGAYRGAFEGWASRDPEAASQYLVDMPDSAARNHGINGLVKRHRWEDPVSSLAWADQISQPELRESTIISAGQAYLRKNPAEAKQWLTTSGLSPDAQQRVQRGR